VLNSESKRETASMVNFSSKQVRSALSAACAQLPGCAAGCRLAVL